MKRFASVFILQSIIFCAIAQTTTIIPFGSAWKYLDNGTNQATAWRATSFSDASWKNGAGQFGYGDGDEATIVSYGKNAKRKYITTYFRKVITVDNSLYSNYTISIKRDDGAVVYVNGNEVFRTNMPTGTISYTTKASTAASDDGNTVQTVGLPAASFVNGNNTIAVEVHQVIATDSDLSFDLQLLASGNVTNAPPIAIAGADQIITLPTNSVTLDGSGSSDADGTITAYGWTKVSGPSTYTITSPGSGSTTVTGLVVGTYTFRLTVTDNKGAQASDDVVITVNPASSGSSYNVVDFGSVWKYLDNGTNQGTAWSAVGFSDGSWASGPGQLGYGDGDEATVVSYGSDPNHKYITTYFRKVINVSNPSAFLNFKLNVKRDDGIVVYVNGIEVYRNLMTTGTISYNTLSSGGASDDGNGIQTATLASSVFVNGANTIAAEIHQNSVSNSDISFDMQLVANGTAANIPPVAKAGNDQTITLPTNSVTLSGSGSTDADGTITSYAWSKASGPSTYTITTPSGPSTTVTNLVEGTYTFRLTVKDNNGATATDDVNATVNAAVTGPATLIQGPYLQMANGSAITLRWRTDVATDSKISVGAAAGSYTASATNSTSTSEHEVRLTGLSADTKYFYSFGSSSQTLQAGTANFFNTSPPASTTRKIGIAAFGDCGTNASGNQSGSLSAYQAYVGSNPADLMLLLGDNAYSSGTDAEYTSKFFSAYSPNILKNHVLFPAPGNHDYASSSSRQADHNIPYYSIFTLPAAAECGGVASGTEAFYSYNWGNIHFLSLDSYGYESGSTRLYDTLGPQVTWIKKDLAANTSKWTIVYFHHPPYTMGSHNSDSESELVKIRQNFIRILERYGVDMVMCGHSHDYERSYLLKGYYGNESSFDINASTASNSSGYYDGSANSCPYNLKGGQVNHGTVYVVSGSSGNDGSVQSGYPHNALPFALNDGGMFYFEVEDNRLDAKFLRKDGTVADKFTILKDAGKTNAVSISSGQSATLTASWKGTYKWSTGAGTQSINVSPTTTTSYTCTDGSSCITDNFTVNVTSTLKKETLNTTNAYYTLNAYPTPVKKGEHLTITTENSSMLHVDIFNDKGQKIKELSMRKSTRISTADMRTGVYYLRTEIAGKQMVKKIMVIE